jgi:hypothetical protein
MLEVKNIEVFGLERALRASGNAMSINEIDTSRYFEPGDSKRGSLLGSVEPGKGHDHFLCGIVVYFDVKYPQYWISEAQRYHWFNIISSQSKTDRLIYIANRDDFKDMFNKYVEKETIDKVKMYVDAYNISKSKGEDAYEWFMRALSNLPMGFEMWMTVKTNYLQLKTMYLQRRNHVMKEDWGSFTRMCDKLPMFKELIGIP